MKYRIWTEKICLVGKILRQNEDSENYAREILLEQYNNSWGGLTEEVAKICETVGLDNICEVYLSREEVKDAMLHHHLGGLKDEMKERKKLDRIRDEDCRYMKSYMLRKSLEDSRLEFKFRTSMLDCRAWMPARYDGVKACPHCPEQGRESGVEESGVHWLTCLRQGQAGPGSRGGPGRSHKVPSQGPAFKDRAGKVSQD